MRDVIYKGESKTRGSWKFEISKPTPLPELIADREAIHAAQKEDLKRKTVKVRKSLLP